MNDEIFNHVAQAYLNGQKISEIYRNGQRIYPTKLLPDEYELLEYIACTSMNANSNWIDTRIIPTASTEISFTFMATALTSYQRIIGYGGYFHSEFNKTALDLFGGSTSNVKFASAPMTTNEINSFTIKSNMIKLNQVQFAVLPSTNYGPNNSITLGRNMFGTYQDTDSLIRIYGFTAYQNGIIVQRLLPCRRKSDGMVGTYDIILNQFVGNSGNGSFAAGPRA